MSALDCRDAAGLLPWLANGSLDRAERSALEAHLEQCPTCRRELERCLAERALLRAEPLAAPMPHPAQLARLFERIDAGDAVEEEGARDAARARRPGLLARTPGPVRWLLAAQLLAMAGLGYLAQRPEAPAPARYRALSAAETPPRAAAIRVVFAPDAPEAEVRAILVAAGVEIVAGPTPVGAYALAPRPGVERDAALALLRADPRVRFAEPVAGAQEPDVPRP